MLKFIADGRGSLTTVPLAGGWTKHRDFPVPQGKTFHDQWKARRSNGGRA
jgi:L-lactate dehydrogenase complex protein LldF